MIQSIENLKNLFKTGKKPSQQDFADVFDSYRHKNDALQISDVSGLANIINNKADTAGIQAALNNKASVSDLDQLNANLMTLGQLYDELNDIINRLLDNDKNLDARQVYGELMNATINQKNVTD
ncbi:MAG: hypothetical protein LBT04_01995 [Prevotellaceae bacterium]|jgi:hypothetical protein|nr:hypothetical protein [Prevotellaceae bacterium]